jgi:hypothetical protein
VTCGSVAGAVQLVTFLSSCTAEFGSRVAVDQRRDIDEVACLGPVEQREELVGAEFLGRQHRTQWPGVDRSDASIGGKIELGGVVASDNRETREAPAAALATNGERRRRQCGLDRGHQPVDVLGRRPEEVQVPRGPVNDACQDSAAPPAKANPSASGRAATIRPTCSCRDSARHVDTAVRR